MADERSDLNEIRAAFDGDDVPAKNIALRRAHDRIAELEATLAKCREQAHGWKWLYDTALTRVRRFEIALREIARIDVRYPPHDPGDYMPPKGRDGPCRKIALAALSSAPNDQQEAPMQIKTPRELLGRLVTQGGGIVRSSDCSEMEIADARARGDFYVDEDGLGYVVRLKQWFDLKYEREQEAEVK